MEAILNITYAGQNGDLVDMVDFEALETEIKMWATEAVRTGGVPGITADPDANLLDDFVLERFPSKDGMPNRLLLHPKTPFGLI